MKNISNNQAISKLIFALDAKSYEDALELVELLSGSVGMFKVGKELFTAAGPRIVERIKEKDQRVFLDLKFHDIPNTVARAAEAAMRMGVDMFNIHAAGGSKMIRETMQAVENYSVKTNICRPIVLAVTVLTSLNDEDLKEIGYTKTTKELVNQLAGLAKAAGASGAVTSAQDIAAVRSVAGNDFVIVTPGIRGLNNAAKDDQKRTMSAFSAIKAGADYIVVGRPIREASDPLAACRQIADEIKDGLAAR